MRLRTLSLPFVYVAFTLLSYAQCTTRLINFGNYDATTPLAINKYDTVVGWYMTYTSAGDLIPKGFRWFNGQSIATSATNQYSGINDYGMVVGSNNHGSFVGYQGNGYAINYPGARYTYAEAINNRGMVVGLYLDANLKGHGFYRDSSGFHSFDVPNNGWWTVRGVNDAGVIVGTVDSHGYAYYKGQIRYIDYPGAVQTTVEGINNYGSIVGEFMTQNGGWGTAFVLKGTKFIPFSYPGAFETHFTGINNLGDETGVVIFSDSENPEGFIRKCR